MHRIHIHVRYKFAYCTMSTMVEISETCDSDYVYYQPSKKLVQFANEEEAARMHTLVDRHMI